MSYMQRKLNYCWGVQKFVENNTNLGCISGAKLNKVMVKFLKEHNLPYKEWNYKYKGINTPDIINAETIQMNWKEFRGWSIETYGGEDDKQDQQI
jgi:hypothetical protein